MNPKTLLKEIKRSRKAWKDKKKNDFISWEEIKKKNAL
jgi:hypothetical protein